LVHLCWNEPGAELAVADSSGRVSIYSISIALNSIAGHRQAAFDPDDDGAQIVGMMWLNTQRTVRIRRSGDLPGPLAHCQYRYIPSTKRRKCRDAGPIRHFVVVQLAHSIQ
jgi:mediator of RNA polymerase II transcription subunit 16